MLYLILALFSGVIGGLVVTLIPRTINQLRNFIVILFAVSSAIFS